MTIKILKIDFREGRRRHCYKCPVARGCLRAAQPLGYTDISVFSSRAGFHKPDGEEVRRDLPPVALEVIDRFDLYSNTPRSDFEPFEFEIEDLPRCE